MKFTMNLLLANLLRGSAQGVLVRSQFVNISQIDTPSLFFFEPKKKKMEKNFFTHSHRSLWY